MQQIYSLMFSLVAIFLVVPVQASACTIVEGSSGGGCPSFNTGVHALSLNPTPVLVPSVARIESLNTAAHANSFKIAAPVNLGNLSPSAGPNTCADLMEDLVKLCGFNESAEL